MGGEDIMVSVNVVNLFTNVAVNEALWVTKNLVTGDQTLTEYTPLKIIIMELLETCLKSTCFQVEDKFFQQKDGMVVGNSLSSVMSNIHMEHFEKLALDAAECKPTRWFRYADVTFVIWPHRPQKLNEFLRHISSFRSSVQFCHGNRV
jgi:hypothetical protein